MVYSRLWWPRLLSQWPIPGLQQALVATTFVPVTYLQATATLLKISHAPELSVGGRDLITVMTGHQNNSPSNGRQATCPINLAMECQWWPLFFQAYKVHESNKLCEFWTSPFEDCKTYSVSHHFIIAWPNPKQWLRYRKNWKKLVCAATDGDWASTKLTRTRLRRVTRQIWGIW